MQERNEMSCSCISIFFNPQQKWFLTRKKEAEEGEVSGHLRRSNKSADLKNQSDGKSQKKSLKKRPNSNVSSDAHLPFPPILDDNKIQSELRITFEPDESPNYPQPFLPWAGESPNRSAKQVYYPMTPKYHDSPTKIISDNQFFDERNYPLFHSPPSFPQQVSPQKLANYQYFHNTKNLPSNGNYYQQHSNIPLASSQSINGGKQVSTNYLSNYPEHREETNHHIQKIHYPTKYNEQQTESWIPIREDSLIIEQFDRLFKNKQEHQSHSNLNQDKHMRAREAKKSKRFEKQLLVGRFAESDDEACSDHDSEVIGKGFESHFQTFWEKDSGFHVEETLATRSTNTKFSELHKNEAADTFQPKFGTTNHFKSYKYL